MAGGERKNNKVRLGVSIPIYPTMPTPNIFCAVIEGLVLKHCTGLRGGPFTSADSTTTGKRNQTWSVYILILARYQRILVDVGWAIYNIEENAWALFRR